MFIIKSENKSNPTEIRSNILVLNEVEILYTFCCIFKHKNVDHTNPNPSWYKM